MRHIVRLAAIAAFALALSAAAAQAMTLSIAPDLPGLKFSALARLPEAPASARSARECDWLLVKPTTAGGVLAATRGWGVTGEASLGNDVAVSFAASFKWGPSAVCEIRDGNVAIFHGSSLVAILYGGRHGGTAIGSISALEGGAARVWSGEDTPYPEGDLQATDGGFALDDVAKLDPVCGGRAKVPNVYGRSIDKARQAVLAAGWRPAPVKPALDPKVYARETELIKSGIPETESCAGTGLANCTFNYRSTAGKLSLGSVGEEEFPGIVNYAVECRK